MFVVESVAEVAPMGLHRFVRDVLAARGYELRKRLGDFEPDVAAIIRRVESETLTSPARLAASIDAVRYVDANGIGGAVVECGVWRGGSSMAMALAGRQDRDLWLFDTFEGMTEPGVHDVDRHGIASVGEGATAAGIAVVEANMRATGYPADRVHLVRGKVEDTIPDQAPERIAVLRLDTDWYESTAHELEHLYPRLVPGGVLIVDDYGHWQGARRAVDEYLAGRLLLARTDYTGRVAVKPSGEGVEERAERVLHGVDGRGLR